MVKKAERSWDKVQEENTIIFGDTQIPSQHNVGQANDSHCSQGAKVDFSSKPHFL